MENLLVLSKYLFHLQISQLLFGINTRTNLVDGFLVFAIVFPRFAHGARGTFRSLVSLLGVFTLHIENGAQGGSRTHKT